MESSPPDSPALPGSARVVIIGDGAMGCGHCVEKGLAFAYVRPRHAAAGTELEILILGERRKARVLPAAPFDPENKRPRS